MASWSALTTNIPKYIYPDLAYFITVDNHINLLTSTEIHVFFCIEKQLFAMYSVQHMIYTKSLYGKIISLECRPQKISEWSKGEEIWEKFHQTSNVFLLFSCNDIHQTFSNFIIVCPLREGWISRRGKLRSCGSMWNCMPGNKMRSTIAT